MTDSSVTIIMEYEYAVENNIVPSEDSNSMLPWIIAIVISSFAIFSASYAVKKKNTDNKIKSNEMRIYGIK